MKTNKLFPTFLLALATLLLPLGSQAQDTAGKSLKECIEYGLKNFGTVRIAQYKVETANQQGREALSKYLPQATASGTFTNNIKLQQSVIPAGIFGPEPQVLVIGSKFQNNVIAQASQTIFDQSLLLGIKANKPNQQLAELNTRQTREDIVYNIASNYYQVYVAQQQISLLNDNLKRTQQVLDVLKLQRDNGVIQPIDYTNTEVTYNNTRSQLSLAENDLNIAINRLKYQMGMPQDAELTLADSVVSDQLPVIDTTPFEAKSLVSFQQAASNLDLQKIQLQRIRAGYLPTLSFTANYGALTNARTLRRCLQQLQRVRCHRPSGQHSHLRRVSARRAGTAATADGTDPGGTAKTKYGLVPAPVQQCRVAGAAGTDKLPERPAHGSTCSKRVRHHNAAIQAGRKNPHRPAQRRQLVPAGAVQLRQLAHQFLHRPARPATGAGHLTGFLYQLITRHSWSF